MRLVERFRLCYRILIFGASTFFLWLGFEFEVVCLRRNRQRMIDKWVPLWSRFNLKVFGVQLETYGKYLDEGRSYPGGVDENKGRIFIANHRSGMDIPILFAVAETHVISRHDLEHWPLLGRAARRIGTLFVDRSDKRSGARVLREVDNTLKRGEGIAMFPEGTAHDGDEVHEFKPGAFNAARRADAEIVPFGLAYDNDAAYFSRQPFLKHMTRVACLESMRVAVEVGEPLRFEDCTAVEIKEEAQKRVQALVHKARARLEDN